MAYQQRPNVHYKEGNDDAEDVDDNAGGRWTTEDRRRREGDGDACFPAIDPAAWACTSRSAAISRTGQHYEIGTWERRRDSSGNPVPA